MQWEVPCPITVGGRHKGKEKTDGNASSEKTGKANKADKTDRTGKTGTVTGRTIGNPKLSEKAAKYYEELKRKIFQYGLYSGQRGSEGEGKGRRREAMPMHRRWWFSSTRTRLSAWREDENYRRQYEAIIANAGSGIAQMKSSLEASGTKVKGYGMQVNDGGTATYLPCCRSLPTRRRSGLRKREGRGRKEGGGETGAEKTRRRSGSGTEKSKRRTCGQSV